MTSASVSVKNVWKKFRKGEKLDSLRDFLPALTRKMMARNAELEIGDKEFWAVNDVSFEVREGEALGIIGPNGSGKSTMLKLLTRILRPTRGEIRLTGKVSALIEVGAGFHPDLTGRENIFLNGTILGMKREEIKAKFDEIVEFSELQEFIDTPVKRYSSGMYARLGFSVAAHVDPEILIIDEVLSVGDFSFQHKCIKKMTEIISRGKAIIFVSHNIPQVVKLCPNCLLLRKGVVEMMGPSRDVCRSYYRANADTRMVIDNGRMALDEFGLYDASGRQANSFKAGEPASVRLSVSSQKDLNGLVMGFFVKQSDGFVVFDANSDKFSDRLFTIQSEKANVIEMKFRVNLPEGKYFAGIHFMDEQGNFYLYQDEISTFYVNAPQSMGYAFLDSQWV